MNTIQRGPPDNGQIPFESLGSIFYNVTKKWEPDRVVLVDITGEEITYRKFFECSVRLAKELRRLGIKKGDVITVISHNQWKFLLTVVAGFYVGAVVNLLSPDYTSRELKRFFSICKPMLIFCTNKTLDIILNLQSEEYTTSTVVVYDSPVTNSVTQFDTLLQNEDDNGNFTPVELNDMEEVALILTSSGTTGFPKCVQLTHSNIRTLLLNGADPKFVDINQNECLIGLLPFFHISGCGTTLIAILTSAKTVILEKFVPDKFLSLIQKHKATKLFAVPPILLFLVKNPLVQKYDISSIQDVLCGGAAINKDLINMVKISLKVKDVRQLYAMTETSGAATVNIKNSTKYGSVGKVVSTFQIKVCDPTNGKPLSVNEFGELRFKGGGVMKGYLGNDEETLNAFDEDGFLKSGDLGYYDTEGFFYIVGRLKEIIKYKGFQVSPAELESLLIQHPAVKDAGVIGVPDERAGELPLAFIVKQNQDVTEEDIIRYVAENVSVQKHLHGGVQFVDAIPKNLSGKIMRTKLKSLL